MKRPSNQYQKSNTYPDWENTGYDSLRSYDFNASDNQLSLKRGRGGFVGIVDRRGGVETPGISMKETVVSARKKQPLPKMKSAAKKARRMKIAQIRAGGSR